MLITVNFLAVFFLEVRILNLGFINMRVDYSCQSGQESWKPWGKFHFVGNMHKSFPIYTFTFITLFEKLKLGEKPKEEESNKGNSVSEYSIHLFQEDQ